MTRMDCRWSCMSKMKKTRKPGGGRKKLKPEYDAGKNLKDQMGAAVALYEEDCSLQSIADVLNLNPIKVRKLLITAGVYESEVAEEVQDTFERYRKTQDYKTSILTIGLKNALLLSTRVISSSVFLANSIVRFVPIKPAAPKSKIFMCLLPLTVLCPSVSKKHTLFVVN